MPDFDKARAEMVAQQLVRRGISDRRVLAAMASVPREAFVPAEAVTAAYDDGPLPIGAGQTISQPYIVALMAEAGQLDSDDRVLDVGTGSGYAAAVLSRLAGAVFSIERHAELGAAAERTLTDLGYRNVVVKIGDGTLGWPEEAPFDAVLVAAGGHVPEALRRQVKPAGRLVMPVVSPDGDQRLKRLTRTGEDHFVEDDLGSVVFVPLVAGPPICISLQG